MTTGDHERQPTMMDYDVTLSMRFSAEHDLDALRQMVGWVLANATIAGYRVTRVEDGAEWFADAEIEMARDSWDEDASDDEEA